MKIALIGNPNSGKTTLFNALSGSNQYVGNWPGVTVEKKSGKIKGYKDLEIVDLPGIYSLSPYTLEEVVSRNFLLENDVDCIINIIDVTNLERNLYLTTQVLELNIPVILACNMMDLMEKDGSTLKLEKLKEEFSCEGVAISALKKTGISELIQMLVAKKFKQSKYISFDDKIEKALNEIKVISGTETRFVNVKYFEKDQKLMEKLTSDQQAKINKLVEALEASEDDDCEAIIANQRYNFISKMIDEVIDKKRKMHDLSLSDKIDQIVTNRFLAIPLFVVIMYLIYSIAMSGVGLFLTDFTNEVIFGEWVPNFVSSILVALNVSDVLSSLILDGIVGGVGSVLGFVPQILVLFFLLAFLEDSGYMARVAFIMDRVFRKFGLSGKSFIPMLVATGCGVPGIMASRTIENEKDRRLTIMLTTFMPCSAKLPIFTLFAGACFGNNPLISTSMYFLAIAMIIICGILLKKTKAFGGDVAPFVMELPAYHMPSLNSMVKHTWSRGESFIKKAGSVILLSSILIWILSNFNFNFQQVNISDSILASIGHIIAPIFAPLGWGDWKASVATITGLIAKENIVMTFGVLYGLENVAENGVEIWTNIASQFTPLMAYSFMAFNLLCAPCFAAIGTIKRELGTWKATLQTVAFQCIVAYVVSLLIFQIGSLFF